MRAGAVALRLPVSIALMSTASRAQLRRVRTGFGLHFENLSSHCFRFVVVRFETDHILPRYLTVVDIGVGTGTTFVAVIDFLLLGRLCVICPVSRARHSRLAVALCQSRPRDHGSDDRQRT